MNRTITHETTLVCVECYACGTVFAMDQWLNASLRRNGGNFYCPNGHSQCYTKLETDRLKDELAATQRRLDAARAGEVRAREEGTKVYNRLKATKGVITRMKNHARKLIAQGVCPYCKRPLTNETIEEHIAANHVGETVE